MSIVEWVVTYIISWWIVLFMVLPFWVRPSAKPIPGQAMSAPENPQLKRKFIITSLLALIPTLIIFSIMDARAGVYHAGSDDCKPLETYTPPADLAAKDLDATLNAHPMSELNEVTIGLDLPLTNYVDESAFNADLSETEIAIGTITTTRDGNVRLNNKPIGGTAVHRSGCIQHGE